MNEEQPIEKEAVVEVSVSKSPSAKDGLHNTRGSVTISEKFRREEVDTDKQPEKVVLWKGNSHYKGYIAPFTWSVQ